MKTILDIQADLEEFENSGQSEGYDLRLDLADIILRHLDGQKWTQASLAKAAGMKASYLTRVIHSSQNCTFEVAGRILHALGVKARIEEVQTATVFNGLKLISEGYASYGKERQISKDAGSDIKPYTREFTATISSKPSTYGQVRYEHTAACG